MHHKFIDTIRPRISDINFGGHVGHTELINLLHEIRVRYLHKMSVSESDIDGNILVVRDMKVDYRNQIFWNNELEVTLIVSVDGAKIRFNYSVLNKSIDNNAANADIVMMLLNKEKQRPQKPDYFIRILNNDIHQGTYQ